jgi:hypothetical protein
MNRAVHGEDLVRAGRNRGNMTEQTVSRTLVKSPPELWAEVSDPGSLARHLGEFGEIRITRLEGESTVAWEGERASGTVELAPSGWGTRVTLTARVEGEEEVVAEPEPEPEPEPVAEPEVVAEPEPVAAEPVPEPARQRFFARWFRRRRAQVTAEPIAEVEAEPAAEVETEPVEAESAAEAEPQVAEPDDVDPDALATLTGALDSLGSAHHRPFSRG